MEKFQKVRSRNTVGTPWLKMAPLSRHFQVSGLSLSSAEKVNFEKSFIMGLRLYLIQNLKSCIFTRPRPGTNLFRVHVQLCVLCMYLFILLLLLFLFYIIILKVVCLSVTVLKTFQERPVQGYFLFWRNFARWSR